MDLRAMQSIYTFPTLVIFASGKGIATAKALIEATSDATGLDLDFRQTVRLYYRVCCLHHTVPWCSSNSATALAIPLTWTHQPPSKALCCTLDVLDDNRYCIVEFSLRRGVGDARIVFFSTLSACCPCRHPMRTRCSSKTCMNSWKRSTAAKW